MLRITNKIQYSCQPKNKYELHNIIYERIKEDGFECDLNDIDVSEINDMSFLFCESVCAFDEKKFNGDISMWDVSNVIDMNNMFYGCKKFNCDLSKWNVSKVENMNYMFFGCKKFSCDISKWDVSNVEHMDYMFYNCGKFDCDLSSWNVSNVTHMHAAFEVCPTTPDWYNGLPF